MKTRAALFLALLTASTHAGPRTSANYIVPTDTTDAGGRRATSASYTHDGSIGLVAGLCTVAAPAETLKSGYAAQLFDVTGLTLNSTAPSIGESSTLQLAAWRVLDDATFLATNASAVTWSIPSGPLTSISANGLATAGLVFGNTPASVQATFGAFTSALNLTVLDIIPDNFGAYAGDGLGDDWQVQFFGQNNPLAAPALDPDGDGLANQFEFVTGMIPTDPCSCFYTRIEPVAGQPSRKNIVFSPRLADRTYTVQSRSTLTTPWQPLSSSTQNDNGSERTVTDLNAAGGGKFYRVEITRP